MFNPFYSHFVDGQAHLWRFRRGKTKLLSITFLCTTEFDYYHEPLFLLTIISTVGLQLSFLYLGERIWLCGFCDEEGSVTLTNFAEEKLITCGSSYLVRSSYIIFWNVRIHVFQNVGGQRHLVRDTKDSGVAKRRMVTGQKVRKGHVWSRIDR